MKMLGILLGKRYNMIDLYLYIHDIVLFDICTYFTWAFQSSDYKGRCVTLRRMELECLFRLLGTGDSAFQSVSSWSFFITSYSDFTLNCRRVGVNWL